MPLVTIESVAPADAGAVPRMLAKIQSVGAKVMVCSPSNIWAIFRPVQPGFHVQGDGASVPLIVVIRANIGRTRKMRDAFVTAIAEEVAHGLSWQEMQLEDVWFEGRWSGGRPT